MSNIHSPMYANYTCQHYRMNERMNIDDWQPTETYS